jgi:hypothetical protein
VKGGPEVIVRFACPHCELPARAELTAADAWRCLGCGHALELAGPAADGQLAACAACGNPELYRKKDFPHRLGLALLAASCLAFLAANLIYRQWWGWAILLGTALLDGVLYLVVGDAVVCYRCGAVHHALPVPPRQPPFELGTAERYRQERLRREQLKP